MCHDCRIIVSLLRIMIWTSDCLVKSSSSSSSSWSSSPRMSDALMSDLLMSSGLMPQILYLCLWMISRCLTTSLLSFLVSSSSLYESSPTSPLSISFPLSLEWYSALKFLKICFWVLNALPAIILDLSFFTSSSFAYSSLSMSSI